MICPNEDCDADIPDNLVGCWSCGKTLNKRIAELGIIKNKMKEGYVQVSPQSVNKRQKVIFMYYGRWVDAKVIKVGRERFQVEFTHKKKKSKKYLKSALRLK